MKTRMMKIIIVAAALLLAGSGISFANDWKDRDHKPSGKAYGHYQVKKQPPGWDSRNWKPLPPKSRRYVYKPVDFRPCDDRYRRPAPREDAIFKVVLNDPIMVVKIIVKDHR